MVFTCTVLLTVFTEAFIEQNGECFSELKTEENQDGKVDESETNEEKDEL